MTPDWFDFKQPDYVRVYELRKQRLERIRKDPAILPGLLEHYKNCPVDFINDWGMTFDPRNAEIGLPTTIPFLLFKRQEEFVVWLIDLWHGRLDGLAEKSRDMGVSWLCVAVAVWMWRFHAGTVIGFGSRKEEYVDKIGDPKALFWKVRQFIRLLPKELRPAGYNEAKHAPHMRILNPENGASIIGEAGDNIGRGNRTSIYFKDESAFYEHPDAIDAALSQTSNCKIDISTPNGNGNPFFRKRHSGKIKVFSFHWKQDPRKDIAWYEKQKNDLDPVILAQEVDIDYNASTADAWINGQLVENAQQTGPALVEAVGGWIIGVDAAHFGDDESVIHKRNGRLNMPQVTARGVDGPQLAGLIEKECDDLVYFKGEIFAIVIELDGPGVSCYDQLLRGRYGDKVQGIHTGARQADQINYNLRARMWRAMLRYLESPPVSLPPDMELKSQIASMRYYYKDSLLLMQDKKTYKKEFGKSPDRADAFALTFAVEESFEDKPEKYRPRRRAGTGWSA
jgi:phage terminase large subunit